jgi:extracellular elastinolytic metalloproteinase
LSRAVRGLERLEPRLLLFADPGHDHTPLVETYTPPSTFRYNPSGFLTGRSTGSAVNIALNYLRQNANSFGLQVSDLASPFVNYQYKDDLSGITHIYLMQEFNGLEVGNALMNVSVMPDGRILSVGGGFMPGLGELERTAPAPVPQLDPRQALRAVADELEVNQTRSISITNRTTRLDKRQTLVAPDFSRSDIPTNLQYTAMPDGSVQLGWKMIVDLPSGEHWYEMTVDTDDARVLRAADYINHATYNVLASPTAHPHDPTAATAPNRNLLTNPHDVGPSPFGWHDTNGAAGDDTTETRGNNVLAQEDADGNNGTGIRAQGGAGNDYDFPLDLTQIPSVYRDASLTNLFYWNNVIHDVAYRYGFTPAARNFQLNNYGLGGLGNDYVQADGQDGGGINNANFATPADGSLPRMQMYLWSAPTPDRDGSLDNRIIVHEYGHGISNRLTGTGSGNLTATQSGGMGEGWSDTLSLLFTQDPSDTQMGKYGVGTYALGQPNDGPGVRRFPYSNDILTNPLTFGAFGSGTIQYPVHGGTVTVTKTTAVHPTGEIWCSTLWDMNWNLINKHGFNPNFGAGYDPGTGNSGGNQLAMRLILDGMKLQPAQPSFIQSRDAILAADVALTGGQNQLEIWRAFARRGLGVNASTASSSSTTVNVDFNIPVADPFVNSHTPTGTIVAPASFIDFRFNQAMDQTSFSVLDDVVSFTGPGGADLKPSITGFSWQPSNTLRVTFSPTAAIGSYSMQIGPNILAADNGNAMDVDADGIPGEIPDDIYNATFAYATTLGPEGFGYKAADFPVENIDLIIGTAGTTTVNNGVNDTAGTISLPAGNTFNFYGTTYTSMFVNPNGLITFGTSTTSNANGDLTSVPSQASIAVLWDNWTTNGNAPGGTDSATLWRVDGNRLIIEWSDVPHQTLANGSVTFQAILQLNTAGAPGRIILNYPDLTTIDPTTANGAGASVGIKAAGTQGANRLLINRDSGSFPWVQTGKAILVALDVTAPQVTASNFNFQTSQSITMTFDDNVSASLAVADLVLHNNTTNTDINSADIALAYDGGTNTATFTFPGLPGGILPDGDYTATLLSAGVTDAAGNPLDGDGNGTIGGNHSLSLFFLNGDANRDRTVNLADFNIMVANFGGPGNFGQGDFTYDGTVNLGDFNVIASQFGKTVAPAAASTGGMAEVGTTGRLGSPSSSTTSSIGSELFGPGSKGVFGQVPITPLRSDDQLAELL